MSLPEGPGYTHRFISTADIGQRPLRASLVLEGAKLLKNSLLFNHAPLFLMLIN